MVQIISKGELLGGDFPITDALFLGRGWATPFRFNSPQGGVGILGGSVSTEEGLDMIRMSVRTIILVQIREMFFRRDFGSLVPGSIQRPSIADLAGTIQLDVQNALNTWEPRIELLLITVDESQLDQGIIVLELEYRLVRSKLRDSMVLPFALGREEAA